MTPALLFIYDGVQHLQERWYNIIQGVLLTIVVLFRYEDSTTIMGTYISFYYIHYVAAVLFFLGSLFEMVYFSNKAERTWKIIIAVAVLIGMSGCFIFNKYTILVAEWIGILQMSIHTYLEQKGKIS
jgi:hypothetical protein